jgi:hypothetical protein
MFWAKESFQIQELKKVENYFCSWFLPFQIFFWFSAYLWTSWTLYVHVVQFFIFFLFTGQSWLGMGSSTPLLQKVRGQSVNIDITTLLKNNGKLDTRTKNELKLLINDLSFDPSKLPKLFFFQAASQYRFFFLKNPYLKSQRNVSWECRMYLCTGIRT